MTVEQKRLVLIRIRDIDKQLEEIRDARLELSKGGVQSATLSSGGGTKSFTKMDISSLNTMIDELAREKEELQKALYGSVDGYPSIVYSVYM